MFRIYVITLLLQWAKVLYLKHGTQIFHHYILIGLNVILVAIALIGTMLHSYALCTKIKKTFLFNVMICICMYIRYDS